ncbi:hypothetical protein [Roseibacillus persicicus]|uniref:hypothetical protein n=1 Tax=Roseibacillus persicicus TaxID=454148 RepID=UPI00280C64E4|nr:hypothetical protein [Roseibacillus persicicus]MDQ8189336.1 hypothetical protein [Roseibacillus persicicus]
MNKYQTIIAIAVSGILSASAQARHDEKDVRRHDNRSTNKVVVQKTIHHGSHGYRVQNSKKVVKLPRNHRRVSHRGKTYYVVGGVCYQAVRSGFIVVKKPW